MKKSEAKAELLKRHCLQPSENEKSDRVESGVTSATKLKIQLEELKHFEHFYFYSDSASSKKLMILLLAN